MSEFTHLENALRTLGRPGAFSRVEKQAIRDQLFLRIGASEQPRLSYFRTQVAWLTAVPVAIFALFLSLTTGVVAQQALPGDTLFVLKRAVENLQLFMTRDPLRIASVRLQIADDRMRGLAAANTPRELSRVLDSTQATLADANKAVSALPKDMAENLVTRFEGLLEQQNTLLDRLSKTATSEEIKTKIVAIKEELKGAKPATSPSSASVTTQPTPAQPAQAELPDLTQPGFVSLTGSLGTAYGQPAVILSSTQYFKLITPLSDSELISFVSLPIIVRGQLDPVNKTLTVSYLSVNSRVVVDIRSQ